MSLSGDERGETSAVRRLEKVYIIQAFRDDVFLKRQMVPSFLGGKLTISPVQGTSRICTVKERSHMKIIRQDTKAFILEDIKRQRHALQSTLLGICSCTRSSNFEFA